MNFKSLKPIVLSIALLAACLVLALVSDEVARGEVDTDTDTDTDTDEQVDAGLDVDYLTTDVAVLVNIFRQDVPLFLRGPTLIKRQDPTEDSLTGSRVIETEIISMELHGTDDGVSTVGPAIIRAGSSFGLPPSTGKIVAFDSAEDFPAESFFDVFFEVEVDGFGQFKNHDPFRIEATIDAIPPVGESFVNPASQAPVQLFDAITGNPAGEILEMEIAPLAQLFVFLGADGITLECPGEVSLLSELAGDEREYNLPGGMTLAQVETAAIGLAEAEARANVTADLNGQVNAVKCAKKGRRACRKVIGPFAIILTVHGHITGRSSFRSWWVEAEATARGTVKIECKC